MKINGFGKAKCSYVETANASELTIPYASPELILNKPNLDYNSDIFSFGVLMYEYLFDCYPIVLINLFLGF